MCDNANDFITLANERKLAYKLIYELMKGNVRIQ